MTVLIENLGVAGYRSFGGTTQIFPRFDKINIFIGQNNSGKSNILRFIDEVWATAAQPGMPKLGLLASHQPGSPPLTIGVFEEFRRDSSGNPLLPAEHRLLKKFAASATERASRLFGKVLAANATVSDGGSWTFYRLPGPTALSEGWAQAVATLTDDEAYWLFTQLTPGTSGGARKEHWNPAVIKALLAPMTSHPVKVIPAIRQIGAAGTTAEGFDGAGIIDRLAKLQNPGVNDQASRQRFDAVTRFLRDVVGRPDARIEIPYERDTILVHMDNKVLPVESLGSGIHEVLILASAATVLSQHVVCIEEPELHLNPILQKKLVRYLHTNTQNQYFVTTHSAALMDTPEAELYHVRLVNGASVVERVTTGVHRSAVCEDLGYHPSDLVQANCVIWVEGPSDRLYLNWWLHVLDPTLVETIHYSIMFYGGRLAAHLSCAHDEEIEDFISLRRLNRRGVILIDSDKDGPYKRLNATKRRLQQEFDAGPGHAWITAGREIENYLQTEHLAASLAQVVPSATPLSGNGRYESALKIRRRNGQEDQGPKVEVARHVVDQFRPNLSVLDLESQLEKVRAFVIASNPA